MYDNPDYFLELLDSRTDLFLLSESLSESVVPTDNSMESIDKPLAGKADDTGRLNTQNPEQLIYETQDLKITIWGGIEKDNLSRLKISMHIKSKADKYKSFRDDVNLYSHSGVKKLIQNIAEILELSTPVITYTITDLTEKLESYRLELRESIIKSSRPKSYEMSDKEKAKALNFLKSKDLGSRTLQQISRSGLIGEERNGLLLFFLYLSRLMDEPLHAIIFGKSGSGKTYLQTKVSEAFQRKV